MGRTIEPPQDLVTHLKRLEKRIENLERSQRASFTALDIGSLVITDGVITSKHPNGTELFHNGKGSTILPNDVDPTNGYLTEVRRGNNQPVFSVFTSDTGTEGRLEISDRNGNHLVSDDYLVGKGLGRPWIPLNHYSMTDYNNPPIKASSGTWTPLFVIGGQSQHPAIYIKIHVVCSDGTTSGNVRLQDVFYGTTMWSASINAGLNGDLDGFGTLNTLRDVYTENSFELQVQRTAGTGTIGVLITNVYGSYATSI